MQSRDPPRVLHVLGSLNRGGIETWLLHMLRNAPPGSWTTEFLLHRTAPGAYDDEMRSLGAVIHYGGGTRNPVQYTQRLRELLRTHGPYDVVHSHVHFYSGIVLRAAHVENVPVRVAQSHTTHHSDSARDRVYQALMRRLILEHATHALAGTPATAAALYGEQWRQLPHVELMHYGLDYAPLGRLPDRATAKEQLGLPPDRIVIGHVGRFAPEKNHAFVLATFAELVRGGMDAHLLLVGSGPLEAELRNEADALGLTGRCTFAGAHNDVTPYYGALDLFLFPSFHEGLGLVVLEAQAAAVPVLASTGVPAEAAVVPGLVHRRALLDGPRAWAQAARDIMAADPHEERAVTAQVMAHSRYSVLHSIRELARIYRDGEPDQRQVVAHAIEVAP